MSEEDKGFVIKDRRTVGRDVDEPEKDGTTEAETAAETADQPAQPAEEETPADEQPEETLLPEVNFPTFVMSLNVSAL